MMMSGWCCIKFVDMRTRRSTVMKAEYTVGLSCSIAGTAMGLLALTTLSATAGGQSSRGLTTAILLSIIALTTGGLVPLVPRVCHRFGVRRTYVVAMLMTACVWAALGVLEFAGLVSVTILYLSGIVLGAVMAATTVLKPLYSRVFLGGAGMSVSYARQSFISGFAWVVGALIGGVLIAQFGPGWPLVVNAVLFLPLAYTVGRSSTGDEPKLEERGHRMKGALRACVRDHPAIRDAMLVGSCAILLVGPMSSMVVPLVDSLESFPEAGAGLLMAAIGLGRVGTPAVVSRMGRRMTPIAGVMLAEGLSGALLIVLAVSSMVFTGVAEVVVWCMLGAAFGVGRFSGRAFVVGAGLDSVNEDERVVAMTSLILVALLTTPLGLLLWGVLLDVSTPQVTLLVAGVGMLLAIALLRLTRPTLRAARPD